MINIIFKQVKYRGCALTTQFRPNEKTNLIELLKSILKIIKITLDACDHSATGQYPNLDLLYASYSGAKLASIRHWIQIINDELIDSQKSIKFIDRRDPIEAKIAALWGKSILYDIQTYHPTRGARRTGLWGKGGSLADADKAVKEFYESDRSANVENKIKYFLSESRTTLTREIYESLDEYDLMDLKDVYNQHGKYDPEIEYIQDLPISCITHTIHDNDFITMDSTNDLIYSLYSSITSYVMRRPWRKHVADCKAEVKWIKYNPNMRSICDSFHSLLVKQFKIVHLAIKEETSFRDLQILRDS
ncbi:MAG: hypothetical protein KAH18_12705 [Psychromonas sp.]|nr:hypothetical protein [Psychromonas sp.]